MPDITMCVNINCPNRGKCYRYLARASERQSFSIFCAQGDQCDHYWPSEDYPQNRLTRVEDTDNFNEGFIGKERKIS